MKQTTGVALPDIPGLASLQQAIRSCRNLPRPLLRKLAGPKTRNDGVALDLHTQVLTSLQRRFRLPPLGNLPPPRARLVADALTATLALKPLPLARVEDRTLPLNGRSLPARLYADGPDQQHRPLLVYFHGGGFVIGGLDAYDGICRGLARWTGCNVVSVAYRLAPESPYPAAVDDCRDAYLWLTGHLDGLGLRPRAMAVGGDSAGGTLSAVLCQQLRDRGDPLPDLQLLIYPVTDLSRSCPAHALFGHGPLLDRPLIDFFLHSYLPPGLDLRHPHVSPLFAESMEGLPEAVVVTARFDPLRDEGRLYVDRLREAGVPVWYQQCESMAHGFISMAGFSPVAAQVLEQVARHVGATLARIKPDNN